MKDKMSKDFVSQCVTGNRNKPKDIIIHSELCSKYCIREYQNFLKSSNFACSMRRKENCLYNTQMKNSRTKLKQE